METTTTKMPDDDQLENKENIVLRSLVGDPNRHTPMVDHRSPMAYTIEDRQPAAMYILETRYQPIPTNLSPKPIDDQRLARESPISVQSKSKENVPTVFLQPKVLSQPVFYNIADRRSPSIMDEQPLPTQRDSSVATVYALTGRSRRPTTDMSMNNKEIPTPRVDETATIYTLVANPRFRDSIEETSKESIGSQPDASTQTSPNLYSIIGNPARTSRGVQVSPLHGQRPSPIVYTIVGETPPQTNRFVENPPPPLPPPPPPPTNVTVYSIDHSVSPRKVVEPTEPISKATVYTLGGKPDALSPKEKQTKKRTPPPPSTVINRRVSHSLERKTEPINEETISYPVIKATQQSPKKEPKIPKSEALFVPIIQEENKYPRSEPINHKSYTLQQNQPIQLPDYHSPYAIRTHKPYRERKFTPKPLPIVTHTQTERKPRPPLYEPRYRVDKHYPHGPTQSTISSERYPVNTKPRSTLWDYDYQTQTDDDEEYEKRLNKKKRSYKTPRSRTPWIPVW